MRDDPVLGMKLLFRLAQQFACRIRELNQQLTGAAKAML